MKALKLIGRVSVMFMAVAFVNLGIGGLTLGLNLGFWVALLIVGVLTVSKMEGSGFALFFLSVSLVVRAIIGVPTP